MFAHFVPLLKPYRRRFASALGLAVLACLLNLPAPLLVQSILDRLPADSLGSLTPFFAALAFVFAGQGCVQWLSARTIGAVGVDFVRDLRSRLYARLQRIDLEYFDRTSPGAILARLMDDVVAVQGLATGPGIALVVDAGAVVVTSCLLASYSVWLFVVVVAIAPAATLSFVISGRKIRTSAEDVRNRLDDVFRQLKSKFDGIYVVKVHARESEEIARFNEQMSAAHEPRLRLERLNAALASIALLAVGLGVAATFVVAAIECLRGRMTPAEVAAAGALSALLFAPLPRLAETIAVVQQSRASLDRLRELLDENDISAERAEFESIESPRGAVEFDAIEFAYRPGKPVLSAVSATVPPGSKVAIVGPTGSGKSTLLNLLLRLYEPTAGEIRLDGRPLRKVNPERLRRQIGVVSQETVIFHQTIAENIAYGCPDASPARIRAAAHAAHLDDVVAAMPNGFATMLGDGGAKLSQGERQRIAIARAICKDPAIVVLDEATSSLDTESERLILAALANLLKGRTTFVIAHRLQTIVDADVVFVMDKGRLIQTGSHAQLLAEREGLYCRLFRRQSQTSDASARVPCEA